MLLWLLIGVGVLVVILSVRDLLGGPDPTLEPEHRQPVPRGGDHTDWARAWDGPTGGGPTGGGPTGDGPMGSNDSGGSGTR